MYRYWISNQANMRSKCFRGVILSLFLFLMASTSWAAGSQVLTGAVPQAVAHLTPLGQIPGTNRLNLAIALPWRNQSQLTNLLDQIYNPKSPKYHHYLTPAEFIEQFAPGEKDYQAVIAFAKANGLAVTATYSNRCLVDVSGSAADVQQAFHLTLNVYKHPTENRNFYAPTANPSLNLSVPVLAVIGLDNYELPRPHLVARQLAHSQIASPNSGSGPNGTYRGTDFRAAYVPGVSLNGSGQQVGLLELDGYSSSDITYYEKAAGLPNIPLQNILIDGATGGPEDPGGADVEVTLDIEMAISMATNLSQVVVYIAPNGAPFEDVLNKMVANTQVKQFSCSWYVPDGPSQPAADAIWQEMAAQGQSFFNASGDSCAYTGLIPFPGDSPYITQVGGTTLSTTGPGGAWSSETVWNWGIEYGPQYNGVGSSGGVSTQYQIPSWQTNISMTANQGSTTMRNTPDVALTADNVYVRADGEDFSVGGTSCAAPLWAGFGALVNQQAVASGKSTIGFINPALDAIGTGAGYSSAFHDTVTGNNTWSGSPSKFYAVAGYGLCTGWGTPAGQNLINDLANPEPLVISPATGFASIGGVGGPFTVTSGELSLTNFGTNTFTWSLSNTSAWLNASPSGGMLTPGGPATIVTVSLNNTASNLVLGTYNATLSFTNLHDNVGQTRQFTLNIVPPPTITSQPANQAVLEGAPAVFNVSATGGLPLGYQWQFDGTNLTDGGNISGSLTTNLVITDISSNDVGNYTCVVTNPAGVVVSSNAALTIISSAPVIAVQPTNETVFVGTAAFFDVTAYGNMPLSYQWSFDGTNIAGATNSIYVLPDAQLANAGNYSVLITNALGSILSSNATLTVQVPTLAGYWPFYEGSGTVLHDVINGDNGTIYNGTWGSGISGSDLAFNGSSTYVGIPSTANLNFSTNAFTISVWFYGGPLASQHNPYPAILSNNPGSWQAGCFALRWQNLGKDDFTVHWNPEGDPVLDSGALNEQHWYNAVVVRNGTNISLYIDAVLTATATVSATDPVNLGNGGNMFLGGDTWDGGYSYYLGSQEQLRIYQGALSLEVITNLYTVIAPPTITIQPQSQAIVTGNSVTFNVVAGSSVPPSYQWQFNGANISGATNETYTIPSVAQSNAGNYTVVVANILGSTTSSNAVLTVYVPTPPSITTQPTNLTVTVASSAIFNVTANGTPPLDYQWTFDGTNILGATNATLTLTDVQLSEAGTYAVLVTNDYGSVLSSNATLTVQIAALVGYWPFNEGSGTVLHDIINGDNGTIYNGIWDSGISGSDLDFDGSSTYVAIPSTGNLNFGTGAFSISLWFSGETDDTYPAILSNNPGGWQPGAFALRYGNQDNNVFSVHWYPTDYIVESSPINKGTWHNAVFIRNGTNINLYIDAVLTATATVSANSTIDLGQGGNMLLGGNTWDGTQSYYQGSQEQLRIYQGALTQEQITNLYTVIAPPTITAQPQSQAVPAGNPVTFSIVAGSSVPPSYQWQFNGANISDATNATYTIPFVVQSNAGNYAVVVANALGSVTSSNAMLTVEPSVKVNIPVITSFNPSLGATGTVVNISGLNFSPIASSNIVYFGAVQATVSNASPTNLVVSVPVGATYAPITETVNGMTAYSDVPFLPTFPGGGTLSSANFASSFIINGGNGPIHLLAADIDGDGKPDLVVAVDYDDTIWIYRNISTNGILSPASFAPPVELPVGPSVSGSDALTGVAVGDLTGDGHLDIVVADRELSSVCVFQNFCSPGEIGTNTFGAPIDIPIAGVPTDVAVADMDGDGQPDMVSVDIDGSVSVIRNLSTADGILTSNSFEMPIQFQTGFTGNALAVGDIDGDGKPDVVIGNASGSTTDTIGILQNLSTPGNIDLASNIDFPGTGLVNGIAIGDVDGDGKPDVVVSSAQSGSAVMIYRNTSTPGIITTNSLAPAVFFPLNGWGADVAIGDLNGDGKPDIGTTTQLPDNCSLFQNLSTSGIITNSSLGTRIDLPAGYNPDGLTFVDLAGDGRPDLVFVNTYDGTLTIYQNITLMAGPPIITTQPTNQTVSAASSATFSVVVGSTTPVTYQWMFDGTNSLPGATNCVLTLTNVQAATEGEYSVVVTNVYDSIISSNALLVVTVDHFAWNVITSPKFVNTLFPVEVIAKDAANEVFTNYTGIVFLSATNGVPVAPTVSSNFVQGVWTGSIAVPQPVTGLVLSAGDGAGHIGLANPINVVYVPVLGTTLSGGAMYISWPTSPAGFFLEQTTNISSGPWIRVTGTPLEFGGEYVQPVTPAGTNAAVFYRLYYNGP
jgi:subtilase family serine protease